MTTERHYSTAELAGRPGMPTTERGVRKLADRLKWPKVKRNRGKGCEYPLSALPPETRAHLAAQITSAAARAGRLAGAKLALSETITEEALHRRRVEGLKASLAQPASGQARINAKLTILGALDTFVQAAGLPLKRAMYEFCLAHEANSITVSDEARRLYPSFDVATLQRWRATVQRDGVARLAGRYGNRRGDSKIDRQPALNEFVVSMMVSHPHASTAHVLQAIRARFNGHTAIDYPSPRALQRWMLAWKSDHKQVFTAITNPDAWKGKYMSAFGSQSEDILRLNQRWELDSTPGDVMLTDGRHTVIGVTDVYPRRAKLLVSKTSKATAIATLVRHALLDWGVPEVAKTDNGTDYKSHHMNRVFRGLDIEQEFCPPFQPWHKPHIERFFGSFSHDLVELLAGFIGHNVAERRAIEARASFADRIMKRDGVLEVALSSAEFQEFCDRWCDDIYAHRPHEGLGGQTPFEVVAAWRHPVRRIEDERALDVLLAEAPGNNGLRTVQKKGIELDRAWFIAQELALHIGNPVHVRFDPQDLGRIYVFDQDENFLCVAECPERTGMDRREVGIKGRAMQTARKQEEKRALKATARRLGTDDIVNEILAERAEAAGKLARLPLPATTHHSAGLAAAGCAAQATRRSASAAPSDDERADTARIEREITHPRARAQVIQIDDPERNYRRWIALDAGACAGQTLAPDDHAFWSAYRGSDEWRAMEKLAEDFPELRRTRA